MKKYISLYEANKIFNLTDKELKTLGWNTIGGRIEEFSNIAKNDGLQKAYNEIKKQYKDETDGVFRGLLVFIRHGIHPYYDEKLLK